MTLFRKIIDPSNWYWHLFIDVGSTIRIMHPHQAPAIQEAGAILYQLSTRDIVARGDQAALLAGRTPEEMELIWPFPAGEVQDFEAAVDLLEYFFKMARKNRPPSWTKRFLKVGAASYPSLSDLDQQNLQEVLQTSGVNHIDWVPLLLAAAWGAGYDAQDRSARLILHLGRHTTAVGLVAGGQLISSQWLDWGGQHLTQTLTDWARDRLGILLAQTVAKELKETIASVSPPPDKISKNRKTSLEVQSRNLKTGLPEKQTITRGQMRPVLVEALEPLVELLEVFLDRLSATLLAQLSKEPAWLTGGASRLAGLDQYLHSTLNIPFNLVQEPQTAPVRGLRRFFWQKKRP